MKTSTIYLIIGMFVAIILGMIIFTFLAQKNIDNEQVTPPVENNSSTNVDSYDVNRIEATHFYIDGVHTIVGSITMPTPCDLLDTSYTVAESMPEQITFEFDVINTADTCIQVMTEQRFKIEVSAVETASMRATFMGSPVELNLIPAAEGETPEDFELFIKG